MHDSNSYRCCFSPFWLQVRPKCWVPTEITGGAEVKHLWARSRKRWQNSQNLPLRKQVQAWLIKNWHVTVAYFNASSQPKVSENTIPERVVAVLDFSHRGRTGWQAQGPASPAQVHRSPLFSSSPLKLQLGLFIALLRKQSQNSMCQFLCLSISSAFCGAEFSFTWLKQQRNTESQLTERAVQPSDDVISRQS